MKEYTDNLFQKLDEQLSFINLETDKQLEKCELSLTVIRVSLDSLKVFIKKYKFKSVNEEIKFFKSIKPRFYSRLIYFLKIYNIESKKPNGSDKAKKRYFKNELNEIELFFNKNLDFIKYIRTNKSYMDNKYFVRDKFDLSLTLDSFYFDSDTSFCTTHDFKVSRLLANELLEIYIKSELTELENLDTRSTSKAFNPKVKVTWTASKATGNEFVYAAHSLGIFNNGNVSIKDLAEYFELVFNIDLGNIYVTYQEMKERTNSKTLFLDALTEALVKRMNQKDDKLF